LGGLDYPTSGSFPGKPGSIEIERQQLTHVRRRKIGFIFQFYNLLPCAVMENIALPVLIDGQPTTQPQALEGCSNWLAWKIAHHRPDQLSGGQQQRVAIVGPSLTIRRSSWPMSQPKPGLGSGQILGSCSDPAGSGATIVMVTRPPLLPSPAGCSFFKTPGSRDLRQEEPCSQRNHDGADHGLRSARLESMARLEAEVLLANPMKDWPWLTPFFIASRNLRSRLWRSLLTALGISLGVAVVLAIDVTNRSTIDSLEGVFDRAVGMAELLVIPTGDEETIDGELIPVIQRTPGVQIAAPNVSFRTMLADDGGTDHRSPGVETRWSAGGVQVGQRLEIRGMTWNWIKRSRSIL
jgi:putative ABC transport system ATP-binding protein